MFLVLAFLTAEVMLVRQSVDSRVAKLLTRCDLWYLGSAVAAIVTGIFRLEYGAKAMAFCTVNPMFWLKVALFTSVVLVSAKSARQLVRWCAQFAANAQHAVSDDERARIRRLVMVELHLLAFVPLAAVLMARGIGI